MDKMTMTLEQTLGWLDVRAQTERQNEDYQTNNLGNLAKAEEAREKAERFEAMAETVRTLEVERDRLRRVVNAAWGAFTDADEVGTPLWEALEKEGFVVCREATKADAAEAFAYERGIYPGGRIIELTPAGRAALNPSTGVGEAG